MRGIKSVINHLRYMRTSRLIMTGMFTLAMIVTAGVGVYSFNKTDAFAADCSDNSIVRCGFNSYEGLTAAYNKNEYGDIRTIFDHYWIKPTLAPGTRAVMGVADSNGNVIADGRVVANNASSIGRQQIQHSHPISIGGKTYYETSHVGGKAFKPGTTQLPALVVLDEAGNFKYAVLTDCGNPIYAKPVPPPTPPKPEPKPIQVCELATKKYPVTIKENEFDSQKHSKNPEDCKEAPKPKEIRVCELETKTWITISETLYDEKKHSTDQADCEVTPITPEEPTPPAPKPTPTPTPVELPKTGTGGLLGTALGVTSMAVSAYYYATSRRNG